MNQEKYKEIDNNLEIANNILNIIEKSYTTRARKSRIPFDKQFEMVNDIFLLLKSCEEDRKKTGNYFIKRFIPLLDLLIKIDSDKTHILKYLEYLKESYKISARISLHHYMVYREWDERDKFYEPRYETLKGYIHFLEKLEIDPNFHTLICNMPSGYGKTFPAKISESWGFGQDPTGTFLSLCSNDDVVKAGSTTCKDELKTKHFGEVFPEMAYSEDDKNYFTKDTEALWKLKQGKLANSYIAKTTSSNTVGNRASKRIHIDDLYPNHREALNQKTNQDFYNDYLMVWYKRFVQNKIPKILITGTLWASGDFIDLIINLMKKRHKFKAHPIYKWCYVSEDGSTAIVQIPALDYESGLSTMPKVRPTSEILKEKASMEPYLFQTNFQQKPTDPESLFFSYNKLKTFETYPKCDYTGTWSVIDANRKSGKDNFSMPIFGKRIVDNVSIYPLKDVLFTKVATKDLYEDIVDKIKQHRIIYLVIESNVAPELASNLKRLLKLQNITYCEIVEKYTTGNKKVRIEDQKGNIIKRFEFPKRDNYPTNSQMANFMDNLTLYNNSGTNPTDDAPDSIAIFGQEIIEEASKPQKAIPMQRIF